MLESKNEKSQEWKIPLYKIYSDDEDLNLITKIIKKNSQKRQLLIPRITNLNLIN